LHIQTAREAGRRRSQELPCDRIKLQPTRQRLTVHLPRLKLDDGGRVGVRKSFARQLELVCSASVNHAFEYKQAVLIRACRLLADGTRGLA
jgi:hypothetical protein